MRNKQITITVSGPAMSGKSGVAFAIAFYLSRMHEIQIEMKDDNGVGVTDCDEQTMWDTFRQRVDKIALVGTPIIIQTRQTKRVTKGDRK